MNAWLLKDFGLDNLVLGEAETPVPKAGELLVKVGAVSLNFRDKAIVDGIYDTASRTQTIDSGQRCSRYCSGGRRRRQSLCSGQSRELAPLLALDRRPARPGRTGLLLRFAVAGWTC